MKRVIALAVCILFFSSCTAFKNNQSVKKSEYLLGTIVSITVYDFGTADEKVLDDCFRIVSDYEQMFSYYDENSELFKLNKSAYNSPVPVSDELFRIIKDSLEYCRKTEGAFDIGLGKLIEVWDAATAVGIPPENGSISKFIDFKGHEHIFVNDADKTVCFDDERTAIHLGACAKGFVQDRVAEFLNENGVSSALLDFGGSVQAIGDKNGVPFLVGITDPLSDGELAGTVEISDSSVVTSGNYRRFFEYNGIIYHHILDSSTGYPSDSGINGVSILCDSSFKGDCLSTAAFVIGSTHCETMLQEEKVGYVIITDESTITNGVNLKNEE